MDGKALLLAASLAAAASLIQAAEKDVFAFIPLGGRTLLAQVLGTRAPPATVQAMIAEKHTREEWQAWLRARNAQLPALAKLTPKEQLTLADYMAFNLPLAPGKAPASPTQANWEKALPMDGRDMALEKCQGCHIITVVITQDRSKDAWLGTMSKPSHVMIRLGKEQREALASYLVLNAAIPIDDVPQELRAGGATY